MTNIRTSGGGGSGGATVSSWLSPVADLTALAGLTGMSTNDAILVQDDGDGKQAQYSYSGSAWVKIADADFTTDHAGLSNILPDQHHPQVHGLGGADHNSASLAELNAIISDANLSEAVIATQAEAEAGTNNVNVMTPLRTVQATSVGVISGARIVYNSTALVDVEAGLVIEVGGVLRTLAATVQVAHGKSDSTAEMVYIYVDPDAGSGGTSPALNVNNFVVDTTAPTYDAAKRGYYHPSNTDQRYLGGRPVNASDEWAIFSISSDGRECFLSLGVTGALINNATNANFADVDASIYIPNIENVLATVNVIHLAHTGSIYVRKNGESGDGTFIVATAGFGSYCTVPVDSNGIFEYKDGSGQEYIYIQGFIDV